MKSYIKRMIKVLLIPILLYLGQGIIELMFIARFNLQEIKTLKTFYPYLSNQEIDEKLLALTKTADYQSKLNEYMNQNLILILLLSAILIIPIVYWLYKKTVKDKEKNKRMSYSILLLPIFYNCLLYCLHLNNGAYQPSELSYFKQILASGVYGPLIEELVFRGIIFNKLKQFNEDKKAIIIATLLFALMHKGIYNVLYATIIGSALTVNYNKYKSIKQNILIHSLCNIIVIFLIPLLLLNYHLVNVSLLILSGIIIFSLIKRNKFV